MGRFQSSAPPWHRHIFVRIQSQIVLSHYECCADTLLLRFNLKYHGMTVPLKSLWKPRRGAHREGKHFFKQPGVVIVMVVTNIRYDLILLTLISLHHPLPPHLHPAPHLVPRPPVVLPRVWVPRSQMPRQQEDPACCNMHCIILRKESFLHFDF